MGDPTDVAEVASDLAPHSAVAGAGAGECMGHFVQQRLVDGVVVTALSEVPRHCNALAAEVAQARAPRRSIEIKAPRGIEVQGEQGIRPVPHTLQVTHSFDGRRQHRRRTVSSTARREAHRPLVITDEHFERILVIVDESLVAVSASADAVGEVQDMLE